MGFKFEELKVWQKAMDLTGLVHELTRSFPVEEQFVLSSQIKRAADSVALNIAEGSTGQSNREFSRFVGYAKRSAIEVVCCLHIGKRRGLISDSAFDELYGHCEEIARMLSGLGSALKK